MRLEGIDTMLKLASKSFLLPSVQYSMLCGWQRVVPEGTNIGYVGPHTHQARVSFVVRALASADQEVAGSNLPCTLCHALDKSVC